MIEFNAHVLEDNMVQLPDWLIESAGLKKGDVLRLAVLHKVIVQMAEKPAKKKATKTKAKAGP
ncbi:MAG: hypothetical protein ACFFDU_07265 [Candidatus Thorarchaeota archaeon]